MTKEDAARELPGLRKRIEEACRTWNREDGIIGLLCLEDAYDDLGNSLLPMVSYPAEEVGLPDIVKVALFRHLSQRFVVIAMALDLISNLGQPGPRTITRIPPMTISISFGSEPGEKPDLQSLFESLVSHGKLKPDDAVLSGAARLMGKFELGWILRIEGCKGTVEEKTIDKLLDLADLISKQFVYVGAVRLGLSFSVTPGTDVPLVNYPESLTPEGIMAEEDIGPRTLFQSSVSPAEWTSSFAKALESTLPTIRRGIDSHSSKAAMKRERQEFFKGFAAFPGFSDLFESEFGYSLSSFEKIIDTLEKMAVPRIHHVYIGRYEKIVKDAARRSGLPVNEARRVMSSLMWKRGNITRHHPVIELSATHVFSLNGIRKETVSRVEGCFQIYDNNIKGLEFERFCRTILQDQGFVVHQGRFKVLDQVLSDEDSRRIWGKVKTGTDFDAIGSKGIYLLVLECKARKPSTLRRTRLKHMLSRYGGELILKSSWLANNIGRLSDSPCLARPMRPDFILPLLVYNMAIGEFKVPDSFLTSKELDSFARTFDFSTPPKNNLSVEVILRHGLKQTIMCIPIKSPDTSIQAPDGHQSDTGDEKLGPPFRGYVAS